MTDIMTYTGSEAAPDHISHKLLHMIVQRYPPALSNEQHRPVDRYSTYSVDAATEYVAQKLAGNPTFLKMIWNAWVN